MPTPQIGQFDGHDSRQGAEPSASDRRDSIREPARDLSDIVTDATRPAMPCMIKNLSGTGALIEAGTREVPDRFVLVNHVRKFRSVCRVRWRHGGLIRA